MKLGYNTNGLAFHRWNDALELLAETGYRSVAITIDQHWLDPASPTRAHQLGQLREALGRLRLDCVIETGARFLLDPRHKHEPTLLSRSQDGRQQRIDFLKTCIDTAADLQAPLVSLWSGILRDSISRDAAVNRLVDGCRRVLEHAETREVRLAFEPEPGMLIESMDDYAELAARLADAPHFGLTLDIGHVQCVETRPIPEVIQEWSSRLWNVHIEDMCRGVHEHLRFGEGEIDFGPVLQTLSDTGYPGGIHVELSRHSHLAPEVVQESYDFLSARVPSKCVEQNTRDSGPTSSS